MQNNYSKVVLITGASSGIGKAAAYTLMEKGFKVYGTSRKIVSETTVKAKKGNGFLKMIPLDVCSQESIDNCIKYILKEESSIDILINNAGFGIAGSVEDTSFEEAFKQFDTNFFGVLRMCRAVLPKMREQKNGLIINISSVAGLISIPYQSMYSASKYALEAMTEALRIEVKQFGIKVSMVEPGDTKTGFTAKREYTHNSLNSVYSDKFKKSIKTMERDEQNAPSPKLVVDAILKIINSDNPPIRITAGFSYKILVFLKRLLPSRFVEYVVSKIYS
ncbi:Short-chain dehydrogenase [Clostridium sp. USBA 49]|uniref:SDR family NAD(P)-dependent oxidoreductase n=1 Tax=Clostridium sp. USBA 49 TaxID=1881060 RepID=UPI0009C78ED8|nr:SDR family NAD(P)-dependent oxidoreductase [Clostridium sp. USBA 49]SKA83913.1 Short-chain dehydrogenase [Clostridium sp. USBA 49]